MRIECPHCKASGTINDLEIPDEGRYLSCPRCKESFQVKKPRRQMTSAYATNTCPSCGYSTCCEEVFDQCPQCGVVVKTLMEQRFAQQAQQREHQTSLGQIHAAPLAPALPTGGSKYLRSDPDPVEKKPLLTLAGFGNGFEPVAAVGWGAVLVAVILLAIGLKGVLHYHGTDIQLQLSEQSLEPVSAWQVFWGYGFWPWVATLFGGAVLVAAFGFLQRQAWGLQAMEGVVLAAVVLVPLYELAGYVVWIVKSIAPPWWAYLVELFSVLLISSLCVVPLLLLVQYLRGDRFNHRYRNG
jgi:predicted Zn finger-like uncharacterized protein